MFCKNKKQQNAFNSKRLDASNINQDLSELYPQAKTKRAIKSKTIDMNYYIQDDYGSANDCTLTSLTTIIYYHCKKEIDHRAIYSVVRNWAEKHFFNGKSGTFPLFIKRIFDKSLKSLNIKALNTKAAMVKGIGFNLNTIKKAIDNKKPIAFSIFNDGRDYYSNHTITIVGYEIFKLDNNKKVTMLLVYDNWTTSLSYVDYDLVCTISSVNY